MHKYVNLDTPLQRPCYYTVRNSIVLGYCGKYPERIKSNLNEWNFLPVKLPEVLSENIHQMQIGIEGFQFYPGLGLQKIIVKWQ